jgi:redox-sensing transcriptional repressor
MMTTPSRWTIARLFRYEAVLIRFKGYGSQWIFSEEIADALGLTSAQVRKDFSEFRLLGRKKKGYHIEKLLVSINRILSKNKIHRAVLVGNGPFARNLLWSPNLVGAEVEVSAYFDEQAESHTPALNGIPVLPLSSLTEYVNRTQVPYGIIVTDNGRAQRYLDQLVLAGVRGILNLSPDELKAPAFCTIRSISIAAELGAVIFLTERKAESAARHARKKH